MAPRNYCVSPRRAQNLPRVDDKEKNAIVQKLEEIRTAEEFNSVAREIENRFQVINKKDEKTKNQQRQQHKTKKLNSNRPKEIQELFSVQRRRATQEVLFGPTEYCMVSSSDIHQHCEKILNAKTKSNLQELPGSAWPQDEPITESNAVLNLNFTKEEVLRKLESKKANTRNSCPGPDNLTYWDLFRADPHCEILTALFNTCLKFQIVPDCWKISFTILVHKSGDKSNLDNWRQITMCNTTAKLFSSLLAARLCLWITNNKRISPTQKGYLSYDASCENSFILQECKVDAKRRRKQLLVAKLDFSKAFESIPQSSVHNALRQQGVPETLRNIIKSMYNGATTKVKTVEEQGYTAPITITAGMRQGCPLSPILFNLAIEPILRMLSANPAKYKLYSQDLNHLAFADDLTLIADSSTNMKKLLQTVESSATSIGLTFNTEKSVMILHRMMTKNHPKIKFVLQGKKVPILEKGQTYKYLGVTHSYSIGQTDIPSVEEMIQHVGIINSSNLSSSQKIVATGFFIIPRVEGCLRGLPYVTKAPLKQADKILKDHARQWLKLPNQASPEVITMPLKEGGAGFLPFTDLTDIMKIIQAFKMLTANDPIVKQVALDSLRLATSVKMGKADPNVITYQEMTSFLSGDPCLKINDVMTTWSMVRQATKNLKKKLRLSWQSAEDGEIQLVVKHIMPEKKETIIRSKDRTNVTRCLKIRLVEYNREMLYKKNPNLTYYPVRFGKKKRRQVKNVNKQNGELNDKQDDSNKKESNEGTLEQTENTDKTIQLENGHEEKPENIEGKEKSETNKIEPENNGIQAEYVEVELETNNNEKQSPSVQKTPENNEEQHENAEKKDENQDAKLENKEKKDENKAKKDEIKETKLEIKEKKDEIKETKLKNKEKKDEIKEAKPENKNKKQSQNKRKKGQFVNGDTKEKHEDSDNLGKSKIIETPVVMVQQTA